MAILQDFAELLTAPPGSLTYHLMTLFAAQIMLGMAVGYWRRQRGEPAAFRMLITTAAITLTRIGLIVVALLQGAGIVSGDAIAPPLERFLDLAALFLVTWTFLPILQQYKRMATALMLIGLLVGGGTYVVSAFLWLRRMLEGSFFNHYWQSSLWELLSIAILVPTMIVAALSRRADWGPLTCLFGIWLAGHSLEYAAPIVDANAAGWVRLANLAALPVLTSLVYREALRVADPVQRDLPLELISGLGAILQDKAGGPGETGLGLVSTALARALDADVVALGTTRSGRADRVHIVALSPPVSRARGNHEIVLSTTDHAALANVLGPAPPPEVIQPPPVDTFSAESYQAGHRIGHDPFASPPDGEVHANLFRELGFERAGPLLVQLLAHGDTTVGVLLAGNPISQREWTAREQRILDAVGPALATALAPARRRRADDRGGDLRRALGRERDMVKRTAALQSQLAEQRQQLEALMSERKQDREQAKRLATKSRLHENRAAGAVTTPDTATRDEAIVLLAQELRTPMTSIAGYTELLLDEAAGILGEMQHQFLQRIRSNARRVDGLLDDLLEAAAADPRRPDAGIHVDITAVVGEAVASLSAELSSRGLKVRCEIPPDLPPVRADPDSVSQAVLNLLSNACYASREGTEIVVRAQSKGPDSRMGAPKQFLLVSVTDTGSGISPDDQRRLFHRMYRADNRPIPGVGDTGVGLSVAKTLIEAQGGRVWVESERGAGSTFSFLVPLSPQDVEGAARDGAGRSAA